ncbi:hypothetical protein PLESTB_001466000 [Pleodorina starrii]|uniref:Uncharacterized protein n=1 Tax=Pleodorina starrii TaxID=330485 RepID=A0A9W6BVH9_9CHLO|nr:hypothetical protein PLESTB_001466000 [Pleodorina starrii]
MEVTALWGESSSDSFLLGNDDCDPWNKPESVAGLNEPRSHAPLPRSLSQDPRRSASQQPATNSSSDISRNSEATRHQAVAATAIQPTAASSMSPGPGREGLRVPPSTPARNALADRPTHTTPLPKQASSAAPGASAGDLFSALEAELAEIERRYIGKDEVGPSSGAGTDDTTPRRANSPLHAGRGRRGSAASSAASGSGGGAGDQPPGPAAPSSFASAAAPSPAVRPPASATAAAAAAAAPPSIVANLQALLSPTAAAAVRRDVSGPTAQSPPPPPPQQQQQRLLESMASAGTALGAVETALSRGAHPPPESPAWRDAGWAQAPGEGPTSPLPSLPPSSAAAVTAGTGGEAASAVASLLSPTTPAARLIAGMSPAPTDLDLPAQQAAIGAASGGVGRAASGAPIAAVAAPGRPVTPLSAAGAFGSTVAATPHFASSAVALALAELQRSSGGGDAGGGGGGGSGRGGQRSMAAATTAGHWPGSGAAAVCHVASPGVATAAAAVAAPAAQHVGAARSLASLFESYARGGVAESPAAALPLPQPLVPGQERERGGSPRSASGAQVPIAVIVRERSSGGSSPQQQQQQQTVSVSVSVLDTSPLSSPSSPSCHPRQQPYQNSFQPHLQLPQQLQQQPHLQLLQQLFPSGIGSQPALPGRHQSATPPSASQYPNGRGQGPADPWSAAASLSAPGLVTGTEVRSPHNVDSGDGGGCGRGGGGSSAKAGGGGGGAVSGRASLLELLTSELLCVADGGGDGAAGSPLPRPADVRLAAGGGGGSGGGSEWYPGASRGCAAGQVAELHPEPPPDGSDAGAGGGGGDGGGSPALFQKLLGLGLGLPADHPLLGPELEAESSHASPGRDSALIVGPVAGCVGYQPYRGCMEPQSRAQEGRQPSPQQQQQHQPQRQQGQESSLLLLRSPPPPEPPSEPSPSGSSGGGSAAAAGRRRRPLLRRYPEAEDQREGGHPPLGAGRSAFEDEPYIAFREVPGPNTPQAQQQQQPHAGAHPGQAVVTPQSPGPASAAHLSPGQLPAGPGPGQPEAADPSERLEAAASRAEAAALALLEQMEQRLRGWGRQEADGAEAVAAAAEKAGSASARPPEPQLAPAPDAGFASEECELQQQLSRRLGHLNLDLGMGVGAGPMGVAAESRARAWAPEPRAAASASAAAAEEVFRATRQAALQTLQMQLAEAQARHNARRRQRRYVARSGVAAPSFGFGTSIGIGSGHPSARQQAPSHSSRPECHPSSSLCHILAQMATPSPSPSAPTRTHGSVVTTAAAATHAASDPASARWTYDGGGGGGDVQRTGWGGGHSHPDRLGRYGAAAPPASALAAPAALAPLQPASARFRRYGPGLLSPGRAPRERGGGGGSSRGLPFGAAAPAAWAPSPAAGTLSAAVAAAATTFQGAHQLPLHHQAEYLHLRGIWDAGSHPRTLQQHGGDNIRPPWDVSLASARLAPPSPRLATAAAGAASARAGFGFGGGDGPWPGHHHQQQEEPSFVHFSARARAVSSSGAAAPAPAASLGPATGLASARWPPSSSSAAAPGGSLLSPYPPCTHQTYTAGPHPAGGDDAATAPGPGPALLSPPQAHQRQPACTTAVRSTPAATHGIDAAAYGIDAAPAAAATAPATAATGVRQRAVVLAGELVQGHQTPPSGSREEVEELRGLCALARSLPQLDALERVRLWERLEQLLADKLAARPRSRSRGRGGGGRRAVSAGRGGRGRTWSPSRPYGCGSGADGGMCVGGGGGGGGGSGMHRRSDSPLRGYATVFDRRQRSVGSAGGAVSAVRGGGGGDVSGGGGGGPSRAAQVLQQLLDSGAPGAGAAAASAGGSSGLGSGGGSANVPVRRGGGGGGVGRNLLETTLEVVHSVIAPNQTLAHALSLNWRAVKSQAAAGREAGKAAGLGSAR